MFKQVLDVVRQSKDFSEELKSILFILEYVVNII